jgi:hypothetical protein
MDSSAQHFRKVDQYVTWKLRRWLQAKHQRRRRVFWKTPLAYWRKAGLYSTQGRGVVAKAVGEPKSPFLWPPRQRPTLQIFLHTAAHMTVAEAISVGSTPGKYVQAPSLLAGFSGAMPLH